jgi:hypothetical protein
MAVVLAMACSLSLAFGVLNKPLSPAFQSSALGLITVNNLFDSFLTALQPLLFSALTNLASLSTLL